MGHVLIQHIQDLLLNLGNCVTVQHTHADWAGKLVQVGHHNFLQMYSKSYSKSPNMQTYIFMRQPELMGVWESVPSVCSPAADELVYPHSEKTWLHWLPSRRAP